MDPTDVTKPEYYHKVVDCQWACPAHTPVPEYIRLIAQGRFTESYMLNRDSNVFPGILGRTCDRPCEPACRRVRVEDEPVAICRLKRVAADLRGDIDHLLPTAPEKKNGKRVALIGAGPASLTVANDLMQLGYHCVIFERMDRPGGLMRTNIPAFRLPGQVLDEEINMILDMGVEVHYSHPVNSLKELLEQDDFDAVFIGTGAPKGKELNIPGREEGGANIHIGIEWLESVHFEHIEAIGERVLIIGVGNTAMDCCRTSKRIGGTDVKVVARKSRPYFKASPWELEDAEEERIDIVEDHSPSRFVIEDGRLVVFVTNFLDGTVSVISDPPLLDVLWGDNNCSGAADPVDSLLTLRFDAGLGTSTGDCPEFGQVVEVQFASPHPWGDVDCSGAVTPVDSLKLLRFDAGLGVSQAEGCPGIGTTVTIFDG